MLIHNVKNKLPQARQGVYKNVGVLTVKMRRGKTTTIVPDCCSCLVLSYLVPPVLSSFVLSCPSRLVLFCLVLHCHVLSCPVLSLSCPVLSVLSCLVMSVSSFTVLSYLVMCCPVLSCFVLCCIILSCSALSGPLLSLFSCHVLL